MHWRYSSFILGGATFQRSPSSRGCLLPRNGFHRVLVKQIFPKILEPDGAVIRKSAEPSDIIILVPPKSNFEYWAEASARIALICR